MIIYINVKDGKVDLTKKELEELLEKKYHEGYEQGKKCIETITYSNICPHGYNYWSCPYYTYPYSPYKPLITWTNQNTSTSTSPTINDGTITITSSNATISSSNLKDNTDNTITIKYNGD